MKFNEISMISNEISNLKEKIHSNMIYLEENLMKSVNVSIEREIQDLKEKQIYLRNARLEILEKENNLIKQTKAVSSISLDFKLRSSHKISQMIESLITTSNSENKRKEEIKLLENIILNRDEETNDFIIQVI